MSKLVLFHTIGNEEILVNADNVLYIRPREDHTLICMGPGVEIAVIETLNSVSDSLKSQHTYIR